MSTNRLFRYIIIALLFCWLPIDSFASGNTAMAALSGPDLHQDKRDKKQERGREQKKPEVKEVPQSRRQEKPGEVKQDKREKPADNKRRN